MTAAPLHALLKNLRAAGRLVLLREAGPGAFSASVDQLLALLLLGGLATLALQFAITEPLRSFSTYGVLTWATESLFLLFAGVLVARLQNGLAALLPLLVALAAVQVYVAFYWAVYAWTLDQDFVRHGERLASALYGLWLGWYLLLVFRLLGCFFDASRGRAAALAVVFGLAFAGPLWMLPGNSFWYSEDIRALAGPGPRISVEDTFYAQPDLLEREFAALAPQRPGLADLYFLGFAGYGRQDLFMREVQRFQGLFDDRFDTEGRSLSLINNPALVSGTPIASVTNLRRALATVGRRMDPEEDVLFLYLTSHGGRDHRLAVTLPPLRLKQLGPKRLRRFLDEAGIKWRVIVIQACFSGGFVEALADPHTLVITAAQHDRSSFGCTDQREYSYFGEAFFDRALRRSLSFERAFREASELVTAWEREEGYEASLPQLSQGPRIAAKLREIERRLTQQAERP